MIYKLKATNIGPLTLKDYQIGGLPDPASKLICFQLPFCTGTLYAFPITAGLKKCFRRIIRKSMTISSDFT